MTIKMYDLICEAEHKYEYGCAMLHFDFPDMKKIHRQIDKDDVYVDENDPSFGLETEPHVTLLFGLHKEVTDEQVKDIITRFVFKPCKVKELSLFKQDKFDVLKFDVEDVGGFLRKTNKELRKLPYTSDFPEYHPHMTVAYLKPKKGQEYVDKIKTEEFTFTPKYAIFSKPNKKKVKIEIRTSK